MVLYDDMGKAYAYTITHQLWVTPDQVNYILPTGKERVTMVSCIGDQVIGRDGMVVNMTHRLITIAEPQA
jgi:sortase (surface protein transpeptidase)